MQQTTKKTYEIFGEPTTTIQKNGHNFTWIDNNEIIDYTGNTFYFPIRFGFDDDIQHGYTFKLLGYNKDATNKYNTTTLYKYDILCVETGIKTCEEVNVLVKCYNNIHNEDNLKAIFKLAYGKKKRFATEKATDRPYKEIVNLGITSKQYTTFFDTYLQQGYYIHVVYGVYTYDRNIKHSTKCYGGVTCVSTNKDILVPNRIGQHVCDCNSNAYQILQDDSSKWTPCILMALNVDTREEYDKIRETFEEIVVQANRLTKCDNTNDVYTKKHKTDRQIRQQLEKLLMLMDYDTPIKLLMRNFRYMNIHIKIIPQMDEVELQRYDEMTDVFIKLQSPTPRDYARLIVSLCSQFNLDYDKILEYYDCFFEDNVTTIYTKQHKKDDSLYEEIRQQRLKEEEESKKLKRVDDLIQWDENEDLTNNDMEFLRFTNKRFR